MNVIPVKIIRQIFLIFVLFFMGSLIFREMLPYLTGVLGAVTIYVLFRKWMTILIVRKKWNPSFAAFFIMFLSFIGILLPIGGVIWMLSNKIGRAVNNSGQVVDAVKDQLNKVQHYLGFDFTSKIDTTAITTWVSDKLQNVVGGTFNAFIAIGLMYFLLYYMLTNRRALRETLIDYLPLANENVKDVGNEMQAVVRSNAIGIPLVAFAQGIIALIGFLIFGVEEPFFWFVIVTIGSMIPFVGTLVGIFPVFLISLSSGETFQAWAVLIYGIVVVGTTDNVIRLYVLKKLDDVHPLITLIGVIVGVPIFGFIGLIFGPLLISLFIALISVYKKEYSKNSSL